MNKCPRCGIETNRGQIAGYEQAICDKCYKEYFEKVIIPFQKLAHDFSNDKK